MSCKGTSCEGPTFLELFLKGKKMGRQKACSYGVAQQFLRSGGQRKHFFTELRIVFSKWGLKTGAGKASAATRFFLVRMT